MRLTNYLQTAFLFIFMFVMINTVKFHFSVQLILNFCNVPVHPPPTSSVPIPASPQTTFDVPGAPSSSGTCNDHIPGQVMSGTAPKSETYVHPAPPAPPCNSAEEHGEQEQTGAAYPSYAGYSK